MGSLEADQDLQRLMRFSWKRENWLELDQWLSLADEMQSAKPSLLSQAQDYWYFRAMRKMANGDRDAAEHALRQVLRLRGPDPEITEAMVWLLLSGKKIDHASLDAIIQPFRSQSGTQSELSAPLTKSAGGRTNVGEKATIQAAAWYQQSLVARPGDIYRHSDAGHNMEWAGCPTSANHVRLLL